MENAENEMSKIVELFDCYLEARLAEEPIQLLNQYVREMRICLQYAITHLFLPLPLERGRKFRHALSDQLATLCGAKWAKASVQERRHQDYCRRQIMSCFELAEQIKEEVPDDPITQQILGVDIPILRPFDYGLGKKI